MTLPETLTSPPAPGGRLEAVLGSSPGAWTVDDMVRLVAERGIRVVSLLHVGGDGWLKALDFVPRSGKHLEDILEAGERADGSSLFPGSGICADASDIVLRPRIETAFLDPFSTEPALAILCDHEDRNGAPLAYSPAVIVRRAWERVREELDVELLALGEVEYFLGKRAEEVDAYGAADRGYHAASPFVFGQGLRRTAMVILAGMGVGVKYGHSEVGYVEPDGDDDRIWEQHEIELALAPLPAAADHVVLTQWVLRNLAHRHGQRVSFDPVLRPGHAGSGMHVHLSPLRNGQHLGGADALTPEAKLLIGGLVRSGDALMAFGNRRPESYTRLEGGKETPSAITWGRYNRKALVRLPIRAATRQGRSVSPPTIEFRLPDGSVHPHLLLAGIAQVMLSAREEPDLDALLAATEASGKRANGEPRPIPRNPAEVARRLRERAHEFTAGGVFAEEMVEELIGELTPGSRG